MTIYLAGPDVFAPDASERLRKKKEYLCREVTGVTVLTPFDLEPPMMETKQEIAYIIRRNNVAFVASCDVIVANLNPFRGDEPDSGTVYEVAYGTALGKTVIGYMDAFAMTQRERLGEKDAKGWEVEDFGLPLNLMFYGDNFTLCQDFESVVAYIKTLHVKEK